MNTATLQDKNWYAAYVRPSHEHRVAEHMSMREIDYFLPTYRVSRRWRNRTNVELTLPLFPSYIFVNLNYNERKRVLEVPSVVSIVSSGSNPLPLPSHEIERLRTGLSQKRTEPHPYLNVGERARIKSGPLTGLEGIVLRIGNRFRVVLSVEMIMKSICVDVEQGDLELISKQVVALV